MRDNRADHRTNQQNRTDYRERRDEEQDRAADFNQARDIAEPLADPDRVEHVDHRRRPRQLAPTRYEEYPSHHNLQKPQNDRYRTRAHRHPDPPSDQRKSAPINNPPSHQHVSTMLVRLVILAGATATL